MGQVNRYINSAKGGLQICIFATVVAVVMILAQFWAAIATWIDTGKSGYFWALVVACIVAGVPAVLTIRNVVVGHGPMLREQIKREEAEAKTDAAVREIAK